MIKVQGGVRARKLFDLEDFGIDIPEIKTKNNGQPGVETSSSEKQDSTKTE
jgi:hypothetical protein